MPVTDERNASELARDNLDFLWNPFTQMRALEPFVVTGGSGALIVDARGREYIDAVSSLWNVNVGHGRREIAARVAEQMGKLSYYCLDGGFSNEPAIRLARKLAEVTPPGLKRSFLACGGSEANETAIKAARQYFRQIGEAARYKIVSLWKTYHGSTLGALSAGGLNLQRVKFEPLLQGFAHVHPPYCYRCPYGAAHPGCGLICAEEVDRVIEAEGEDTVAAVLIEAIPVTAAGVLVPPPEYLPEVARICRERGALLIVDEVITGFGRTGRMFYCDHSGVAPDIMTLGKGISSGYLPLAATVTTEEVYSAFLGEPEEFFHMMHGYTAAGHPLACVAGLENIGIIEREALVERSRELGARMLGALKRLEKYPIVGDVRGLGLLAGIELVRSRESAAPIDPALDAAGRVSRYAAEMGVICLKTVPNIVHLAPPLVITPAQLDRVVGVVDACIARVCEELGA